MAMPSFAVSISFLSLVQAAFVLTPRQVPSALLSGVQGRWWALLPPASIVVVIGAVGAYAGSADALTYLALVGVPVLAGFALARLVAGARPTLAFAVAPLFAAAWVWTGGVSGEVAALVLSALACVTLGCLLTSLVAARWLKLGVYAMAVIDACLVAADLLQGPNAVLSAAAPAAGLPSLQTVHFGSASMGFGDLFIAATLGALLADRPRSQLAAASLAGILALGFDLLFLVVDELPTTVPIALALAVLELHERRGARRARERKRPTSGRKPLLAPVD
jgi:hypothetical protein